MKDKIIGYYSIFIGISVIAMWTMILITQTIPEGPVALTFHLFSEFLMATLAVLSGILLIKKDSNVLKLLNAAALGMIVYSVINAAGYYGQKGDVAMMIMFISLFFLTSIAFIWLIRSITIKRDIL